MITKLITAALELQIADRERVGIPKPFRRGKLRRWWLRVAAEYLGRARP